MCLLLEIYNTGSKIIFEYLSYYKSSSFFKKLVYFIIRFCKDDTVFAKAHFNMISLSCLHSLVET